MRVRAVILAGGEGTLQGVLTAKRTKPALPYAGKYRIIDFPLSNCVNSRIFDVLIIALYRPHSLIKLIGAGGQWDLNRDFTSGVRISPTILDNHVEVGKNCLIGISNQTDISMVGKKSVITATFVIEPGGMIDPDFSVDNYSGNGIKSGQIFQSRRLPHDL